MAIELRPHIAKDRVGRDIEHDQWIIYDSGLHVGYVGYSPGAPINLIGVSKSQERKLREKIIEKLGEVRPVVTPPTDEEVQAHIREKK